MVSRNPHVPSDDLCESRPLYAEIIGDLVKMQLEFRLPSTVPSSQNPTAEREQESQSEQEREAETKPVDKPGSGRGSSLNFITFTKPNKPVEKSSERRLIRSHVLRDYHAKRRSASRARLSGQLASSAAQIGYDQASSFATAVSSAGSRPAAPIDPFVSSAIALSKLDKYYLHHCMYHAHKKTYKMTGEQLLTCKLKTSL